MGDHMYEGLSKTYQEFCVEVGPEPDRTLKGFFDRVKKAYTEKFTEEKQKSAKIFSFGSKGIPNSLSLTVSLGIQPYIAGMRVEQFTQDLDDLLENLDGNLTALYSCIRIDSMPSKPLGSYEINLNKLSSIILYKDSNFRNLKEKLKSLSPDEEDLIRKAEAINIKYDLYDNGDRNGKLIHQECKIKNKIPDYHFIYSLSTANFSPIPEYFYPLANGIFVLVSNKLKRGFEGRISDFRRD